MVERSHHRMRSVQLGTRCFSELSYWRTVCAMVTWLSRSVGDLQEDVDEREEGNDAVESEVVDRVGLDGSSEV